MRDIRINCKKVYDMGLLYDSYHEEISKIKENLTKISSRIGEQWQGNDNHNFLESFNAHIYDLDNLIKYLEENGKIMRDTALDHSHVNTDFIANLERSEKDEYNV